MTEQNENLQDGNTITVNNLQSDNFGVSITPSADGNTEDGAAGNTAEDTHPADPRDEIINQQNATIDTLLKRTEELTGQINKLISMGVQITDGEPSPEQANDLNNIPEDYVPLKDLGAEIGKHDRHKPTA